MSFNFSSENNEFNEPSNDNSNKKNNSENLIDQASQEELESKIKEISNQLNMPVFADQMISENHKIFEVKKHHQKKRLLGILRLHYKRSNLNILKYKHFGI